MSEYKLEIKQIVDYPRCRIYRQFIRNTPNAPPAMNETIPTKRYT